MEWGDSERRTLTCGGEVKIVVSPRRAAGSYVTISQVHNGSSGGRQASRIVISNVDISRIDCFL